MKKKCYLWHYTFVTMLLITGMLFCMAIPVKAHSRIDLQKKAVLTVIFQTQTHPCEGIRFQLYRVASVTEHGVFSFTKEFQNATNSLKSTEQILWERVTGELTDYIAEREANITPLATGKTDAEGMVCFSGLETGLYLVLGECYEIAPATYTPVPFLISLPNRSVAGEWDYTATAEVKYTYQTVSDKPQLPQTGQEDLLVPALAAMCSFFMTIGLHRRKGKGGKIKMSL